DNPLDAFLLEAQALAPRRTAPSAPSPVTEPPAVGRRAPNVHDISAAATDGRLLNHVSKEGAETRRRLVELRRAVEDAAARHAADRDRLNRMVLVAVYALVAIGIVQIVLTIWNRFR